MEEERKLPEAGYALWPKRGESVRVWEDKKREGSVVRRILFCNALYDETDWLLVSGQHGLRCLIRWQDHEEIPLNAEGEPFIHRLEVLRATDSGRAVLCKVID